VFGTIMSYDFDRVQVRLSNGRIKYYGPRHIISFDKLSGQNDRYSPVFRRSDPNYSRMILSSNSFMLPKRGGYFMDHLFLFVGGGYGITKNINVHAGTTLLPKTGFDGQLKFAGIRAGTSIADNIHASTGVSGFYAGGGGITMAYLSATFGNREVSFTGGSAFVYVHANRGPSGPLGLPVLMAGANIRLSNSLAFVTDNWFSYDSRGGISMIMGALRIYGDEISLDLSLGNLSPISGSLVRRNTESQFFPWLSFTYCISKGRQEENTGRRHR
jgi:hypothetical protein